MQPSSHWAWWLRAFKGHWGWLMTMKIDFFTILLRHVHTEAKVVLLGTFYSQTSIKPVNHLKSSCFPTKTKIYHWTVGVRAIAWKFFLELSLFKNCKLNTREGPFGRRKTKRYVCPTTAPIKTYVNLKILSKSWTRQKFLRSELQLIGGTAKSNTM